jgi:predicted DNA-binding transcriptional regulator YafY
MRLHTRGIGSSRIAAGGVPAADQALGKIELVIPERLKRKLQHLALFSPNLQRSAPVQGRGAELTLMRKAVRDRRKLRFSYQRADGCESLRTVRPVSLSFFPPVWLLSAWCELRGDFRSFRTDRITSIELGSETFRDEPGKTLQDFLKQVTGDEA